MHFDPTLEEGRIFPDAAPHLGGRSRLDHYFNC
jgi:hypothetical protein